MIRSMMEYEVLRFERFWNEASSVIVPGSRLPPWQRLEPEMRQAIAEAIGRALAEPVPLILYCPACGERHVDEGEQATKPHRTHACQECGVLWAPAVVPTVGVRFLPGCKT